MDKSHDIIDKDRCMRMDGLSINMHDVWMNYWDRIMVRIKAMILSIKMD